MQISFSTSITFSHSRLLVYDISFVSSIMSEAIRRCPGILSTHSPPPQPLSTTSTTTSMAGFELISVDDPDRAAVARILARHSQTTPPTRALDKWNGHGLQQVATSDNLHHSMQAATASTTNAPATLMGNLPALYLLSTLSCSSAHIVPTLQKRPCLRTSTTYSTMISCLSSRIFALCAIGPLCRTRSRTEKGIHSRRTRSQ
jgi:hypothetical protein